MRVWRSAVTGEYHKMPGRTHEAAAILLQTLSALNQTKAYLHWSRKT